MMRQVSAILEMPLEEVYTLFVLSAYRPDSVKELTRVLAVRDCRTSKILRSLESRGYITRSLSLRDRRVEEVELTPSGSSAAESLLSAAAKQSGELRHLIPGLPVTQPSDFRSGQAV